MGVELGNCTVAARNQSSLVLLQRLGVILLCLSGDHLNHLGQGSSVSFFLIVPPEAAPFACIIHYSV